MFSGTFLSNQIRPLLQGVLRVSGFSFLLLHVPPTTKHWISAMCQFLKGWESPAGQKSPLPVLNQWATSVDVTVYSICCIANTYLWSFTCGMSTLHPRLWVWSLWCSLSIPTIISLSLCIPISPAFVRPVLEDPWLLCALPFWPPALFSSPLASFWKARPCWDLGSNKHRGVLTHRHWH